MRITPLVHKGMAVLVAIGTLGVGAPGALAADPTPAKPPAPKCGAGSDSTVRYSGVGIQVCDSDRLASIGQAENTVIIVDDTGFHPNEVTVGNGAGINGNVTFINLGAKPHTATQTLDSPMDRSGVFVGIGQNARAAKNKSATMTDGRTFDTA